MEPKGDPILYYVHAKRQVWAEARPIDAENYKIVQHEVRSGKRRLPVYGFMGGSETRSISRAGIQVFSRQEALEVLAQRETSLQKDGWDGKLQVKRNWLFDLRHFRRFTAKSGSSSQPVPAA